MKTRAPRRKAPDRRVDTSPKGRPRPAPLKNSTQKALLNTPKAAKAAYVKKEAKRNETFDHHCHWPDCKRKVPPAMWGCRTHWFMLPRRLRALIWANYEPGQEISKDPSDDYLDVAKEVQRWIAEHG